MSATLAMRTTLRRYIAESDDSNGYDDDTLDGIIEAYPLLDERGEEPYTWDTSTQPPTQDENEDWIVTYDLHAAAAQIWQEKAASAAHLFTFSADGGQYVRSEAFKQMMQMVRYHRARRAPGNQRVVVWPKTDVSSEVVGNLAEQD